MAPRSKPASDTRGRTPETRQTAPVAQKLDRRVARTRRGLRDALVTLILERGWDTVTVSDVCERADVGRSTFYLHFADKENLLLSGFDELEAHLATLGRGGAAPFAFAHALLTHALENQRLFTAVVGRQSGQQVQWRFRDVLVTLLDAELKRRSLAAAERSIAAPFLAGGFLELLSNALEGRERFDPGELSARFTRLALAVVRAVERGEA